jgi:hypothetical protein
MQRKVSVTNVPVWLVPANSGSMLAQDAPWPSSSMPARPLACVSDAGTSRGSTSTASGRWSQLYAALTYATVVG